MSPTSSRFLTILVEKRLVAGTYFSQQAVSRMYVFHILFYNRHRSL